MRYSYLLVLLLALGLPLAVCAQQPFEQFGVKVKILTLSNGRYPEFFDNDSLRRIGTVVYDTRLERVAYLLPPDSLVGRLESDITARWMAVDPLAEEDAHISPYVFARNNALLYTDPDGRKVVYAQGVSAQFKREFAAAVRYMNAHGAAGNLARLQSSKEIFYIGGEASGKSPTYNPGTNTIKWNPRTGGYTIDRKHGKVHEASPTQLLNHEIAHAERDARDPKGMAKDGATPDAQYGNKEERRVVTGPEQESAKKLGEIGPNDTTRDGHGSETGTLYETKGPTSREEAKPAVVRPTQEQKDQLKRDKQ